MSFADEYRARVAVWSDVQYCMPRMLDTALRYPGVRVLELGVRSGNSTSAFLAAAEQVDGHVWSVDVDPPQVPPHWHESPLWTFIQGDDLAIESPAEAFDVLFIDTLHTYKHTMDELYRWAPRMADGGTILLHDTLLEHVDGEQGVFPVARALDKFRQLTGLPWTEHGGQYGLGEVSIPGA